jgi:hypothetical protein
MPASAPAPVALTITVDVCLFICAGALALIDAGSWSFLVPALLGAPIFYVYGRRAAKALGIKSRDETPHRALIVLVLPAGAAGILASDAGRYGSLLFMTYIAVMQVGERVIWARFRTQQAAGH